MSQRFTIKGELNRIDDGLTRDSQKLWGETVGWHRFDPVTTGVDDIYDVGASRRFLPEVLLPCLWVVLDEGSDNRRYEGLSAPQSLQLAVAKTVFRDKLQWDDVELETKDYLRDRIVFKDRVFTVSSLQIQGQLQDRDVILGVRAEAVRDEQHVFDPDFTPPPPS